MGHSKRSPGPRSHEGNVHFLQKSMIPMFFALLLMGYSLFVCVVPPRVGMADSGDYVRLMTTIGVKHSSDIGSEISFTHFRQFYSRDEKCPLIKSIGDSFARFPASIFTITSYLINAVFGTTGTYNIMYLGILYSIAYSLAFFLFTQSLARNLNVYCRLFLCIIAALIYADSLFVVYFNSFYQEPVFLISLLICTGMLIRQNPKSPLQELSVFCLSISKFQNIIFSVLYAFPIFFGTRRAKLVVALLVLSLVMTVLGSQRYRQPNIFHSFFNGLLMNSPDKDEILSDFALHRPEYSTYNGKGYWKVFLEDSTNKEIRTEFYSKVNIFKIVVYYIRHPQLLISNFIHSMEYIRSTDPKPRNFGNYLKEYAAEKKNYTGLSFFSRCMPFLFTAIPLLSVISMLLSIFRKRPKEFFLMATLFAILPVTVIVCFLGEGFTDFTKHLFSFYSVLSVMGVVSLGNLLRYVTPAHND
jgi:hypothetical protein